MSRLVVSEYVSLDGVIQAPGHAGEDAEGGFVHGGWTGTAMDEHLRYNTASFQTAGAFLFGRLTYEIFAGYWPTVTDPGNEIARALNGRPKYVASRTLSGPEWPGTTVIRDVERDVRELKREADRPILVLGSSGLAQSLAEAGLVDQYELWLHPVALGHGKKLFRDRGPRLDLRLSDSRTTAGGLVILSYEPVGADN
jgi:dihydrofolate reductase